MFVCCLSFEVAREMIETSKAFSLGEVSTQLNRIQVLTLRCFDWRNGIAC